MWAARARAENDKGKRPRCRGSLGYLADGGAVPRPAQVLALEVADADALFAQAVEAGASVRQAVAELFRRDRHGQLETTSEAAICSAFRRTKASAPPS